MNNFMVNQSSDFSHERDEIIDLLSVRVVVLDKMGKIVFNFAANV